MGKVNGVGDKLVSNGGIPIREEIWVEKYRPRKLEDVVGHDEIVERLESYVSTGNIPNMLFSGPAGVGKTTCAHAVAREFFGDSWSDNFSELNASDERGIDVVREKIKNFARTSPVGDVDYKIIFLDESDALCLPPDTEVVTGYPSSPEIKKIEEVAEEGEPIPSVDFGTNEVQPDKGKLVDSGVADFFEMELEDGRTITASPKHPFFTVGEDGKLVEKELRELEIGDEIADFKDDIRVSKCEVCGDWTSGRFCSMECKNSSENHEHVEKDEFEPRAVLDGGVREVSTVKVTGIEYSHRGKAYNITMEDTPNFMLANGILTHNTRDAQPALRRTMEMYTNTCRFILSCNYSSNIIDPIQSRCAVFRFSPVQDDEVIRRLKHIAETEGIEVTEDAYEALAFVSQGDVRRAVNALQASAALGETVTEDEVYATTSTARPEEVEEIIEDAIEGEFSDARSALEVLIREKGISGGDLIDQMHRTVLDLDLDDATKVRLMDQIGETDYRISTGADETIQLEAFLATLASEGSE